MVERAEREPTMEEIVGALRETRRGTERVAPFTVVSGQAAGRTSGDGIDTRDNAGPTAVADLRDGEIQRLLAENAYLNARIMSLLAIVERARVHDPESGVPRPASDRGAFVGDVRAAVEAELRPVLLVLMRLLEMGRIGREAIHPTAPGDSDGIVDLDAQRL
jgi:hypothetical protein